MTSKRIRTPKSTRKSPLHSKRTEGRELQASPHQEKNIQKKSGVVKNENRKTVQKDEQADLKKEITSEDTDQEVSDDNEDIENIDDTQNREGSDTDENCEVDDIKDDDDGEENEGGAVTQEGVEDEDEDEDALMETLAVSKLPPGTIIEARNDEAGLERKLLEIGLFTSVGNKQQPTLPFSESLCLSLCLPEPLADKLAVEDLEREKQIAVATTEAVHKALDKLRSERVKFRRPNDYFAQMVKTDGQMGKIKKKIMHEKEKIEAAQTRRNNRDIKKNRKKIRHEQLEKVQDKKRQANVEIQAVSRLRHERLRKRALAADAIDDEDEHGGGGGGGDDDEFPIDMLQVEQLDEQSRFQKQGDIASGKKKAWKPPSKNGGKARPANGNKRGGRGNDDDDDNRTERRGGGKGRASFKPDGGINKKGKGGKKKRLGKSRRVSQNNKG